MHSSPGHAPRSATPTAMWVMVAGVVVATLVAVVVDGRLGVFVLAATAGLGAVIRARYAEPVGIMIRGRTFDIATYSLFAVVLAVFGVIAPGV
ncbi:DUF3017 domain-containing protein [Paraoerskovia marina]|uniref:DUF3017 domain-containing protein n=1 Tax=Paraoerskovia marina TaxID=545619 RepID=UPI0012DDF9B1|nr:DUF3017 domain-containing protein [Paraoerskovia marina]